MIRDGMVEALTARLGDGQTPQEQEWIARAYLTRAQRSRPGDERRQAYDRAGEKFRRWVDALAAGPSEKAADVVRLAAARVSYGNMLLAGPVAADLGDFEITGGRRGDRPRLVALFQAAREQYEKAASGLAPLVDKLSAREEELLTAGLYETLQQTRQDLTLNLGWSCYYLGALETQDSARRAESLAAAERKFQELLAANPNVRLHAQGALGLGMTQREQARPRDAIENLRAALADEPEPAIAAQARYELARAQLQSELFDEARTSLRPLVEVDPQNLKPDDEPARLYINLAQLWDANSYLLELADLRRQVGPGAPQRSLLQKIQRCQDQGLGKMRKLAARGAPWPTVVQIFVAASVNPRTPLDQLTPVELLYSATALMEAQEPADALQRLRAAAGRSNVDADVAGDIQFELGRCQYQLHDERAAAEAFQRLAAEQRQHPKAPQAATLAYQLWGQVAERTKDPKDFLNLAGTLRNLIENFADHPQREDALWFLPVALQRGGHYDEAAARFAKLPPGHPHWEEAQLRQILCGRQLIEANHASLGTAEYARRARAVAESLLRYADEARQRAGHSRDTSSVSRWSCEARVAAAELLLAPELADCAGALRALGIFEQTAPPAELVGRVLAARMRALAGLRNFDRATQMLREFLQASQPEQVGSTLAVLAQGMREEVERLEAQGQADAARQAATAAVTVFAELDKWVRADPGRSANLEFVLFGHAQMRYLAGQYDDAQRLVAELLQKSSKNGNYQQLRALILTAALPADAPPGAIQDARKAWETLLTSPSLRQRAAERYWEARYNWLALTLRLGEAHEVEQAIAQERVWYPDLGGPPWREKLDALLSAAQAAHGAQQP